MRKKTFRPDEKLTHIFETKQRHKDIMLGNSWVQIQQRVTNTTKSHMMITREFRPKKIVVTFNRDQTNKSQSNKYTKKERTKKY